MLPRQLREAAVLFHHFNKLYYLAINDGCQVSPDPRAFPTIKAAAHVSPDAGALPTIKAAGHVSPDAWAFLAIKVVGQVLGIVASHTVYVKKTRTLYFTTKVV